MFRWTQHAAAAAAAITLAGCAGFSADGGFDAVRSAAKLPQELRWVRSAEDQEMVDRQVQAALARPLSADDAVQVALLNNRGLQAAFAELGIAEAEWVQAGRLPNPGFSFSRARVHEGLEIERSLHLSIGRLLAIPLLRDAAARQFARSQGAAANAVLTLAAETRKAYFHAVAAQESARYAQQVMATAEAGAELARRMAEAGNFNRLQRAREQAFYAEAALNLARAEQARRGTRERLIRHLGLWGEQLRFELPERLPDLPASPRQLDDIESLAIAQRLDVQGARLLIEEAERGVAAARANRFTSSLEVGLESATDPGEPSHRGWEIAIELPLFDWGDARVAKAQALHRRAAQRAREVAVNARSEVREAYGAYRSAHDIARHQLEEVVPLARRISEENLLRYNGMLIGVFELLADARAQAAAVMAAIDAQRDFWIADADLQTALVGKASLMPSPGAAAPAAAAPAAGH
jgi:outer membrane protein TolC